MNNLWTYANMSSLEHNKYTNGDGNITGAVYLIDRAYKNGARLLFLTPVFDYRDGMKRNLGRIERIRELIYHSKERYPGMMIHMGSRVRYFDGIIGCLKSGSIFSMADSRYLLLEFEQDSMLSFVKKGVTQAFESGFRPVLTGIMGMSCITDESVVQELIECGAYVILTIQDILGKMNRKKRKLVDNLIQHNRVHLVAEPDFGSDWESMRHNYEILGKKYGFDFLERVCWDNYRLLAGNGVLL